MSDVSKFATLHWHITHPINSAGIMYVSARIHFSTANISGSVFCKNLRQLLTEIHTPQWPPQLVQNICSPGCLLSSRKFVLPRYKWNTTSDLWGKTSEKFRECSAQTDCSSLSLPPLLGYHETFPSPWKISVSSSQAGLREYFYFQ